MALCPPRCYEPINIISTLDAIMTEDEGHLTWHKVMSLSMEKREKINACGIVIRRL
jgi:hypothetical protein